MYFDESVLDYQKLRGTFSKSNRKRQNWYH